MRYDEMTKEARRALHEELSATYEEAVKRGLRLDISRGIPSTEQLELSMGMLETLKKDSDYISVNGVDTRNYGCLDGLPEAKKLMADVMETNMDNVIIFCDSSLNIMFDLVSKAMTHGIMGSTPWCRLPEVIFLCPVPGYDRHFAITEYFGIKMVNIPMDENGPDMDLVESYVNTDPRVKGIWCVPKYSNPTGVVYSDETVERFARLRPAAPDFRIYWDNAYNVHHLDFEHPRIIPELLSLAEKYGNPDIVYKFGSFSKISFSGSSIAALATSAANIEDVKATMRIQTIGHNKINQLQHYLFFRDQFTVLKHMRKHAAIMKPKFDLVRQRLEEDLGGLGIASWTDPKGGYFVSFEAEQGSAKEIVRRMKEAGVVMTAAGASFPYGIDPNDSNIRIAPSHASMEELDQAMHIFTAAARMVALEELGI